MGMEGDVITMWDIREAHRTGVNAQGKMLGQYRKPESARLTRNA
jgi:hypothetical protein